jgi:hypothetical protein
MAVFQAMVAVESFWSLGYVLPVTQVPLKPDHAYRTMGVDGHCTAGAPPSDKA